MSNHPLTLEEIVSWFRSKQKALAGSDISVEEVRTRTEYLPAAGADFKSARAFGRINGWVSGAFDFEVIAASDEQDVHFDHVDVHELDSNLEFAYERFLQALRRGQK